MPSRLRHLYLHIPFCAKICPYCAFYVLKGGRQAQENFVQALVRELQTARQQHDIRPETIYCGGGTPSLLAPDLFSRLAEALPPGRLREFTLEANPATITPAKAAAWKTAGVNRISLGAQSFDPGYLKLLGRQHAPEDIPATMKQLRRAGFDNINIDLMFALPGQPPALWQRTVEAALACQPEHLSAYALTYEEDTPFFRRLQTGEWKQDEETEIAMFRWTRERLAAAGLPAYEVSNFARPGFESIHNRAYWAGADYLGAGPSACSTVGHLRWQNVPDTAAYAVRMRDGLSLRTNLEKMTPAVRRKEQIMFGLRRREGVPVTWLKTETAACGQLIEERLAVRRRGRLILTERGYLVADSIATLFA